MLNPTNLVCVSASRQAKYHIEHYTLQREKACECLQPTVTFSRTFYHFDNHHHPAGQRRHNFRTQTFKTAIESHTARSHITQLSRHRMVKAKHHQSLKPTIRLATVASSLLFASPSFSIAESAGESIEKQKVQLRGASRSMAALAPTNTSSTDERSSLFCLDLTLVNFLKG